MKQRLASALLAGPILLACQGSSATPGSDQFAHGGGPAPQTVSVSAANGTKYSGQGGISASVQPGEGPFVLFMLNTSDGKGHNWAAQLSLDAQDMARGSASVTLRPGAQAPGSGFIDDQSTQNPAVSGSGTMHITFSPGRQFTAVADTDNPAFSGSLGGTYSFQCFVPAQASGAHDGGDPGTPSGGGVALEQDLALSSTFCQQFKWLQ